MPDPELRALPMLDDAVHADAVRAIVVSMLGTILWPAVLAAPAVALGTLLRTRRLRHRLWDPDGPRRLALGAFGLAVVQLAALATWAVVVGWILVG